MEMLEFQEEIDARQHNEMWEVALVGEGNDDRSVASIRFCDEHSNKMATVRYCPEEMELYLDDKAFQCYETPELIKALNSKTILLDGTTLGIPEIGLLLKHLSSMKRIKYSILYIEPGSYTKMNDGAINGREFNLSSEIMGYKGIPYLSKPLDIENPNNVVFFLGFEGYRLRLALEELNINPHECSLVFGLPSFKPGWEINAFANNIRSINDHDLGGRVLFCGADNPASVLLELQNMREILGDEHLITVAPIGSKPHSIGALAFCAKDKNASVLYDHPIKSSDRSYSVGAIHLFKIS